MEASKRLVKLGRVQAAPPLERVGGHHNLCGAEVAVSQPALQLLRSCGDSGGQLEINLEALGTGFQAFRLTRADTSLECGGFLRVIPPGPEVPRVVSVTDGVCAGAGRTIASHTVRVSLEEAHRPEDLRAAIDGRPLRLIGSVCSGS